MMTKANESRSARFEIGCVCIKLSGKDAGKKCVVIDRIDDITVLVDGFARRKKCNVKHLELTDVLVPVSKGAERDEVIAALSDACII